jgi:hypothetical protein
MGVKRRLTDDGEDRDHKLLDKKVVINVGGVRHESWLSTLQIIPGNV